MSRQLWMMLLNSVVALGEFGYPCTDKLNFCSVWARDGWCERNPRYMLLHCKLACGKCLQPDPSPTTMSTTTTSTTTTSTTTTSPTTTTSTTTAAVTTTTEPLSASTMSETATTETATSSLESTSTVETSTATPESTSTQLSTQAPETTSTTGTEATTAKELEPPPSPDPEPQPQCGTYVVEEQSDLAGKLLLKIPAASVDACCSACDAAAGCAGFVYFDETCYLKSDLSGTYYKAGRQALVRKIEGNCAGFDAPLEGRDLSGELLHMMFATDPSACCSACQSRAGCEGFSYFQQFCYLKSNIHGTYSKPGCSVQLRPSRRLTAWMDQDHLLV